VVESDSCWWNDKNVAGVRCHSGQNQFLHCTCYCLQGQVRRSGIAEGFGIKD